MTTPATATLSSFAGLASAGIANGAYGLAQVYGYNASASVKPDVTTALGANGPTASSWVFSIGQSLNTAYPGGDWVGNIDEVAFWGSALSQAQLFNIYREGVPRVTVRITQQPMDAAVYTNQTVTFSLTAVSYAGALSYQWQSNGVNLAGATSASYTAPALSLANNGDRYRCVVSASGIAVTSREVKN